MSLRLLEIWRYPVKSCRGEQLTEAVVEPWGLAGDRRWMIVDGAGAQVTARDYPRLPGRQGQRPLRVHHDRPRHGGHGT